MFINDNDGYDLDFGEKLRKKNHLILNNDTMYRPKEIILIILTPENGLIAQVQL